MDAPRRLAYEHVRTGGEKRSGFICRAQGERPPRMYQRPNPPRVIITRFDDTAAACVGPFNPTRRCAPSLLASFERPHFFPFRREEAKQYGTVRTAHVMRIKLPIYFAAGRWNRGCQRRPPQEGPAYICVVCALAVCVLAVCVHIRRVGEASGKPLPLPVRARRKMRPRSGAA